MDGISSYSTGARQDWYSKITSYTDATSFVATLKAQSAIQEVKEIHTKEPSPQKLDEFKADFMAKVNALPLAPGLSRSSVSVNITDAAFEKMMADPEYAEEMLALCKRDLCDPAWSKLPPDFLAITIDENKGYGAASGATGSLADTRGKEFWQNDKSDKKRADKKQQEKDKLIEYLEKRAADRKEASKETFASQWASYLQTRQAF